MAKCNGKNSRGEACKVPALKGGRYCFNHAPETRAQQAKARKLGGTNRHTPHFADGSALPANVTTLEEANKLLKYVWDETEGMDNSIARNRLLLACYEMFIRSLEIGELESRIAALENRTK